MKLSKIVLLILFFKILTVYSYSLSARVYFSPEEGCVDAIINEIKHAKKNIYVMAYRLTSYKIAKALIKAYKKGVDVEIIFDGKRTSSRYSKHKMLKNAGIRVFLEHSVLHMHDKIMLIDKKTIITGSYNFTKYAEIGNSENLLILKSRYLYRRYISHYIRRRSSSRLL